MTPGASRRRRRQLGATLLETAFTFPLFISVLLATFDLSYVYYTRTALQHAVREAGRMAQTGTVMKDPKKPTQDLSRADSIVLAIQQHSGAGVQASNITVQTVAADGTKTNGAGGPGDVVTIGVQYQVPLITPILGNLFPGGKYTLDVATSLRNEEF
jgi:Flp pilus assembly protein TadG